MESQGRVPWQQKAAAGTQSASAALRLYPEPFSRRQGGALPGFGVVSGLPAQWHSLPNSHQHPRASERGAQEILGCAYVKLVQACAALDTGVRGRQDWKSHRGNGYQAQDSGATLAFRTSTGKEWCKTGKDGRLISYSWSLH